MRDARVRAVGLGRGDCAGRAQGHAGARAARGATDELAAALLPFAGDSEAVSGGMLEPVPEHVRAVRAPRAATIERWRTVVPSLPPPPLAVAEIDAMLGRSLAGRYELLRRLGRGGMGTVYEAQSAEGARFAVKVIDPDLAGRNPGARRRFVREARAVLSITSPHVVRVFEADSDASDETPFIMRRA